MLTFIEDFALKKFRIWRKLYSVRYEYNRLWNTVLIRHHWFFAWNFVNIGRLKKKFMTFILLKFQEYIVHTYFFLYTYVKRSKNIIIFDNVWNLLWYEIITTYLIEAWTFFTKRIFLLPKYAGASERILDWVGRKINYDMNFFFLPNFVFLQGAIS